MKGGSTIVFNGESDQAPDMAPGDVVIVVDEKPHDRFKRQENDLFHEVEIDLLTALGGGVFSIKHLDDRVLQVQIRPGEVIKPGHQKVIHGQGMPSLRHHEPGDMYVHLKVAFPESINPAAIPALEAALPPRAAQPKFPKSVLIEEVELDELDARQQKKADRSGEAMDEDEGEPRVQCANQ